MLGVGYMLKAGMAILKQCMLEPIAHICTARLPTQVFMMTRLTVEMHITKIIL